jgi:hypothetical protein
MVRKMGHTVSVSVRSQRLKLAMHELLLDNFAPWMEVVDVAESTFSGPLIDDDLFYSGPSRLGFNYTMAVGPEREYIFSIVRWVALKVGRRRRQFRPEGLRLPRPVPYWLPDGFEPWPVLLAGEWPNLANGLPRYDHFGVPTDNKAFRELAWYHIPDGAHEVISATHHGKGIDEIKTALVESGMEGARQTLQLIGAHISRLEALWTEP